MDARTIFIVILLCHFSQPPVNYCKGAVFAMHIRDWKQHENEKEVDVIRVSKYNRNILYSAHFIVSDIPLEYNKTGISVDHAKAQK